MRGRQSLPYEMSRIMNKSFRRTEPGREAGVGETLKKLTILHSNDMHGDFLAEQIDERLVGGYPSSPAM